MTHQDHEAFKGPFRAAGLFDDSGADDTGEATVTVVDTSTEGEDAEDDRSTMEIETEKVLFCIDELKAKRREIEAARGDLAALRSLRDSVETLVSLTLEDLAALEQDWSEQVQPEIDALQASLAPLHHLILAMARAAGDVQRGDEEALAELGITAPVLPASGGDRRDGDDYDEEEFQSEIIWMENAVEQLDALLASVRACDPGLELFPSTFDVRPATGDLILFPGSLQHYVHPYRGSRPRVSISSNLELRLQLERPSNQ